MKVIYFIDVNEKYAEENPYKKYCPREWWKISYPTQPDASTNDLASWQRTSDLMTLLASARQSVTGFTDLPGAALAQTTGTYNSGQIVLDTTAAGHTWYLDPTPFDNTDDYLPTADPNIWKAIPGSAADGKMDLLSVLLHEYGHVLGLQHSGDPRNFMAATLQPGERRLPSAAELQLMANLVAQIKAEPDNTPNPASGQGNNPALPTGQRTPNQPLARRRPELSEALAGMISYQGAVNPTLLNGTFGQNNTDGWVAQGDITVSGSTVTLNESLTMQTHLAQGFMVNEGDHTLSFTLTDQHLTPNASGPSDAFEVALLDANTGLPVVGTVDLTRSDALLNIQTDGAERLAQGVSKVINPNGSATYTITLPDSLAGTPVLLSFDLLGFGAAQSRIILADIHLNG
ncbi:MAG: M10 family metallopeptidase domain-containing protein [Desulfobulbus sp.]|nr:M10 family metallopeptidase domain-containing protein [Desulfobulbus sp.]